MLGLNSIYTSHHSYRFKSIYTSLLSFQGSYSRKFSASSQSTLHITPIVSSSSTLPSYRFKVLILGYAWPKLNLHFTSLLSFQGSYSRIFSAQSQSTLPSYRFKVLILGNARPKVNNLHLTSLLSFQVSYSRKCAAYRVNLHFPPIISSVLFSDLLGLKSIDTALLSFQNVSNASFSHIISLKSIYTSLSSLLSFQGSNSRIFWA